MSAPTLDTVPTGGGGRFDITTADADPMAVLAAVRSGIFQVCKEQFAAEVQRLRPLFASESTAALGAASLVLAEATADDEDGTQWPSRRAILEPHIKQCQMILPVLERASPEPSPLTTMSLIIRLVSSWCRTPLPPAYRGLRD